MCRNCTNTGLPLFDDLERAAHAGRELAEKLAATRPITYEDAQEAIRRGREDRARFLGLLAQRQDQPAGDVEVVRPDNQADRFKDHEIPERQVSDEFLDHNWSQTIGYDPTKDTQQQSKEPAPQQMTRAGQQAAPLPEPWGVLYAAPNPDGSRKSCENCAAWSRDDRCAIHAADVEVTADMTCGYHVFGQPQPKFIQIPGLQAVDPKFSGLESVPGGTSCDTCIAYRDGGGDQRPVCAAVEVDGAPAPVEPLGCCARWTAAKEEPRQAKLDDRYDFQGLKLSIENEAGSTRTWYDKDAGESGETTMRFDYGYIRMTEGTDGDHVDVYVGPNRQSKKVWIVNQMRKPAFTEFDEQKCMLGFDTEKEARDAYLQHYDDPGFLGEMFEMSMEDFKAEVLTTRAGDKKLKPKASKRAQQEPTDQLINRVRMLAGMGMGLQDVLETIKDVEPDLVRLAWVAVRILDGPAPKPTDASAVLAQVGAPAANPAIQQADPEPEYDVGDEVMLKNTVLGLRKNDRGVVVGMQGTTVGVVFFNRPEAAIYIDKDLIKKAPPKKDEKGGGGGWGGGWGKKKSVLALIGAAEDDPVC